MRVIVESSEAMMRVHRRIDGARVYEQLRLTFVIVPVTPRNGRRAPRLVKVWRPGCRVVPW